MKFSLTPKRSNTASLKRDQLIGRVTSAQRRAEEILRQTTEPASIAWAITCTIATIAWSTSSYLIAREKHHAEVERARLDVERVRLELEAKKLQSSD